MTAPITRRQALGVAGLALVAPLAACGKDTSQGNLPAAASGSASGTSGATGSALLPPGEGTTRYPLVLSGPHGTSTLARRPERVAVVAGLQDLEALLALGGFPVISDTISWPWQTPLVAGRTIPQYDIWSDAGLPFEKILAQKPDVILACSYAGLDKDHAKLARIAPVVCLEKVKASDSWAADWREIQRRVALALDLQAAGEKLIERTEQAVRDTAAKHPAWRGRSLSFVLNRGEASGITVSNVAGTSVEKVATSLGFAPQPHARELVKSKGDVSMERLELIDADLLVVVEHGGKGTPEAARTWLESNKLYQGLRAVREHHVAIVTPDEHGELPLAWAFDYPNALSTPWLLQRFSAVVDPVLG